MLFGMVGRLGPRMKQVVGVSDCPMAVDVRRPIVSNGNFVCSCVKVHE